MVVWLKSPPIELASAYGVIRREQWRAVSELDEAMRIVEEQRTALLDEAAMQARACVEDAETEAEGIRAEALSAADDIRKEARQTGLAQGVHDWQVRLLSDCTAQHDQLMAQRQRLAKLVVTAVERIVAAQDRRALFDLAMTELSKAAETLQYASLRVATCDADSARDAWRQAREQCPALRLLDIVTRDELPPGSCELSTDKGMVDMSLGVQLRALRQMVGYEPEAEAEAETGPESLA